MPTEIYDKYEIIRTLHQSAATTVFLIRHKTLGEIRVLKSCIRDSSQSSELLSEANLLSGLHFAGIPTIFDFYQDSTTDYLVEEYVSGTPLSEVLHSEKSMELTDAIDVICGVLEILNYFHTCNPAVIYRDLKPEHIIVNRGVVRIIDMGIAVRKGVEVPASGTIEYASPAQLRGETPVESFDIYATGCVFKEMLYKVEDEKKDIFMDIADKAMGENGTGPFLSVKEMKDIINDRRQKLLTSNTRKDHLLRIAVMGSSSAAGSTCFSIALTCYLNQNKLRAYYVDRSGGRTLQNLEENCTNMKTKDGVIYHGYFYGWFEYGPAVETLTPPEGIFVYDCGSTTQMPADADMGIFVCSVRPWKEIVLPAYVNRSNVIVVANCVERMEAMRLARQIKKKVYCFPWTKNPLSVCGEAKESIHRIVCKGLRLKERDEN